MTALMPAHSYGSTPCITMIIFLSNYASTAVCPLRYVPALHQPPHGFGEVIPPGITLPFRYGRHNARQRKHPVSFLMVYMFWFANFNRGNLWDFLGKSDSRGNHFVP
ncbi:MAG: hypothetical protein MESAZ_03014 [Saezia sanguinis]